MYKHNLCTCSQVKTAEQSWNLLLAEVEYVVQIRSKNDLVSNPARSTLDGIQKKI